MRAEELAAVRTLLDKLGIRADELAGTPAMQRQMPTFHEYIGRVSDSVSKGTRRVYAPYWRRIDKQWGDRLMDEPSSSEFSQMCEDAKTQAVVRRNSRGGRSAAEHMVGAFRCLYRFAAADGYFDARDHPASNLVKPPRLYSTRRALLDQQLGQVGYVASTTGNDPELDALIVRLHVETACRRGGALALGVDELDPELCLVRLHEKGGTIRWQPVSPTLMRALLQHVDDRGGRSINQVLRYRNGRPITGRRYDYLWKRVGKHLPWAAVQQISAHWLRYTTLTWVERRFGYAVARAYAGHFDGASKVGTTITYVRASLEEVAVALAALTGEPHPLAPTDEDLSSSPAFFALTSKGANV